MNSQSAPATSQATTRSETGEAACRLVAELLMEIEQLHCRFPRIQTSYTVWTKQGIFHSMSTQSGFFIQLKTRRSIRLCWSSEWEWVIELSAGGVTPGGLIGYLFDKHKKLNLSLFCEDPETLSVLTDIVTEATPLLEGAIKRTASPRNEGLQAKLLEFRHAAPAA